MPSCKKDKDLILSEAKNIFLDADFYDNENLLIGYYTLITRIVEKDLLTSNSISILGIEETLTKLNDKYSSLLIYYFVENNTFEECANKLKCCKTTTHEWLQDALRLMQGYSRYFVLSKHKEFLRKTNRFVEAITHKCIFDNDILIEELGLSRRTYNCLKRNHINTASHLVSLSTKYLCNLRHLDINCVEELIEIKQKLLSGCI